MDEKENSKDRRIRNYDLNTSGLKRYSKHRFAKIKRLYRFKKRATEAKAKVAKVKKTPKYTFVKKPIGGDKNGQFRMVRTPKLPRYYPTEKLSKKKRTKKQSIRRHVPKLKSSLQPGTVCIVLAGRHAGKRVVFLKQMEESGLILVTGPYRLNRCPLRRMNQTLVIGTHARINLDDFQLPEAVNDSLFRRKKKQRFSPANKLYEEKEEKYTVSEERKEIQKVVDKQVMDAIKKGDGRIMRRYLKAKFSLFHGLYPHKMKF